MLAQFAIEAADTGALVAPVGAATVLIVMLKMTWSGYRSATRNEAAYRKMFADASAARELEFTAADAVRRGDYSASLIRHQQIYAAEVAALQARITSYIEEQTSLKERILRYISEQESLTGRISRLEEEVKDLRAR
jgi:chromosome segregation ATPase